MLRDDAGRLHLAAEFDTSAAGGPRSCGNFFRARVKDDTVAKDLVQETWVEVWEHVETYDRERASFWTSTKIWAAIVLKRHWEEAARLPVPSGGTTDPFARGRHDGAAAEVPQPAADDPAPEPVSHGEAYLREQFASALQNAEEQATTRCGASG